MSGFKLPSTPLELLRLCCSLLALSGIILGHEHGTGVKVLAKEGSDVILPCSLDTKQDITAAFFDWQKAAEKDERQKEVFFYHAGVRYNNGKAGQSEQFRGRVSHFQDQLKHGNASVIITNTKKTDGGNYTCAFPLLQPPRTFSVQLVVELLFKDRSGGSSVATPKPFVTTLDAAEDWALLECEVRGASPKPDVEWQDGDGNKLPAEEPQASERGGSYDITLNITVTKTDRYRCVVEQEDIKHRATSEVFVHISEKVCEDSSTKVPIGWLVLGGLIVLAVQALLVFVKWITTRRKNSRHRLVHLEQALLNRETSLEISPCKVPPGPAPEPAEAP
ncbi:V-set and immunoglobulin domain-containing protein 1-like isoform X1 [Anarhichas minor]|uniref:V-set and immunoglobulin domain-containing protein 1-like isoform X1 n=1 Tax=Anarhichas minor TaxID=65739 RepID=UPI003F739E03